MRCCGRLDCIEGKWVTRCLVVVLPVFGLREEGSARGAGGAGGAGGGHPNHERVLPVDLYRNASHPCFR